MGRVGLGRRRLSRRSGCRITVAGRGCMYKSVCEVSRRLTVMGSSRLMRFACVVTILDFVA